MRGLILAFFFASEEACELVFGFSFHAVGELDVDSIERIIICPTAPLLDLFGWDLEIEAETGKTSSEIMHCADGHSCAFASPFNIVEQRVSPNTHHFANVRI